MHSRSLIGNKTSSARNYPTVAGHRFGRAVPASTGSAAGCAPRCGPSPELRTASAGLRALALAAFVIPVAAVLCGCSGFNYAWKQAGEQPAPAGSIQGRWQGRWLSDVNGHNGALRCIVSVNETNGYEARFRATYRKVVRFSYTVPLAVTSSNGVWHFNGQENLGALAGGVYHYEGTATPTQFHSTYRSKYDHGWFDMSRPSAEPSAGD